MVKTIADLKRVREELVERRRQEVYWIASGHHDTRIETAVQVHFAIQAIDAVIAEGEDQPDVHAQNSQHLSTLGTASSFLVDSSSARSR